MEQIANTNQDAISSSNSQKLGMVKALKALPVTFKSSIAI